MLVEESQRVRSISPLMGLWEGLEKVMVVRMGGEEGLSWKYWRMMAASEGEI